MEVTCRIRMKVPEEYQTKGEPVNPDVNKYALYIQGLLSEVSGRMMDLHVEKTERLMPVVPTTSTEENKP